MGISYYIISNSTISNCHQRWVQILPLAHRSRYPVENSHEDLSGQGMAEFHLTLLLQQCSSSSSAASAWRFRTVSSWNVTSYSMLGNMKGISCLPSPQRLPLAPQLSSQNSSWSLHDLVRIRYDIEDFLCTKHVPVHIDTFAKLWIFFEIALQGLQCHWDYHDLPVSYDSWR